MRFMRFCIIAGLLWVPVDAFGFEKSVILNAGVPLCTDRSDIELIESLRAAGDEIAVSGVYLAGKCRMSRAKEKIAIIEKTDSDLLLVRLFNETTNSWTAQKMWTKDISEIPHRFLAGFPGIGIGTEFFLKADGKYIGKVSDLSAGHQFPDDNIGPGFEIEYATRGHGWIPASTALRLYRAE